MENNKTAFIIIRVTPAIKLAFRKKTDNKISKVTRELIIAYLDGKL